MIGRALLCGLVIVMLSNGCAVDMVGGAKAALDAGRYEEASAAARSATEADPSLATGWLYLAEASYKQGDYRTAAEGYSRYSATVASPLEKRAGYAGRGLSHYQAWRYTEAIEAFERALAVTDTPQDTAGILVYLGRSYAQRGQPDRAVTTLTRAVTMATEPEYAAAAVLYRAATYVMTGHYDAALGDAERALDLITQHKIPGGLSLARVATAFAHVGLGDREAALTALRLGEVDVRDVDIFENLGVAYFLLGDHAQARQQFVQRGSSLGARLRNYAVTDIRGIQLVAVGRDSAAGRANLQIGDIVVDIGGTPVASVEALSPLLARHSGAPVAFKVRRGPTIQTIHVALRAWHELSAERLTVELRAHPMYGPLVDRIMRRTALEEAVQGAEHRDGPAAALMLYLDHLRETDADSGLIRRVIVLAQRASAPPIPEDAKVSASVAARLAGQATSPAEMDQAISEYRRAIQLAPWWADLHYNLALVREKRGDYWLAATDLKAFLLAAPTTREAAAVRTKIYELEFRAKAGK